MYDIVAMQGQYFNISLNGVLNSSATPQNQTIGASVNNLYIGTPGWMPSGNFYFNGLIDEVRISDGKTRITVDPATYMHGKHSWKVEGSTTRTTDCLDTKKERNGFI